MKANEFVKKFGWEYAKHILTDDAPLVMNLKYTNLKRLVESHELVESYGGLGKAKEYIYYHGEYEAICDEDGSVCDYVSNSELIEAIADVESCL